MAEFKQAPGGGASDRLPGVETVSDAAIDPATAVLVLGAVVLVGAVLLYGRAARDGRGEDGGDGFWDWGDGGGDGGGGGD
ncbi:MAG: hypothetical protein AAF677_10295 [Pseudomonadota bacterium]